MRPMQLVIAWVYCVALVSVTMAHQHPRRQLSSLPPAKIVTQLGGSIQDLTFFVTIEIGTPPQSLQLRIDTGSSQTFVPADSLCSVCKVNPSYISGDDWNPFNCSASSTCMRVACSDALCTGSACDDVCMSQVTDEMTSSSCDTDSDQTVFQPCCAALEDEFCGFTTTYADGSVVAGTQARDRFELGESDTSLILDGMPFGTSNMQALLMTKF